MDANSLPIWAQGASLLAIALVAAIVGVFKYLKTEEKLDSNSSIINTSFNDSKSLKDLIEAMRELQDEQKRDAKKSHRLFQDLKEAINELNESIIVQTDSTMNLTRFVKVRQRQCTLGEDI